MPSETAPTRIGYRLSLTELLAGNSLSARLAHDIWREDTNERAACSTAPSSSPATMIRLMPCSFPASTTG